MSTDLRGFRFALEPVRRRQTWQFEALQHRVARKQKEVVQAESTLNGMRQEWGAAHERVTKDIARRLSPDVHRQNLVWLAHLQQNIHSTQLALEQLVQDRKMLLTELNKLQASLQVLAHHQQSCIEAYTLDEERRQTTVADQEWMARSVFVN